MELPQLKEGQVWRANSGVLMHIRKLSDKPEIEILNPKTKERSGFYLDGKLENFEQLLIKTDSKLIDLETYVPTGLVPVPETT